MKRTGFFLKAWCLVIRFLIFQTETINVFNNLTTVFKQLKDHEYLKAVIFLEEFEDLADRKENRELYENYKLVSYVIDLHNRDKFPYCTSNCIDMINIKLGLMFILKL